MPTRLSDKRSPTRESEGSDKKSDIAMSRRYTHANVTRCLQHMIAGGMLLRVVMDPETPRQRYGCTD